MQGNRWKLLLNIDLKFDFRALFTLKQTFPMILQTTDRGFPRSASKITDIPCRLRILIIHTLECWDGAHNTMIKLFHKLEQTKSYWFWQIFNLGKVLQSIVDPKAVPEVVVATLLQPQGWLPFSSKLSSFWSSPFTSINLRKVSGSLSLTTGLILLCLSMKQASHSSGSSGLTFVIS